MGQIGVDRLAQGIASAGGGGGNTESAFVTANLAAGANAVAHNLGTTPTSWTIQDANGRILALTSAPDGGDPDNIINITGLKTETNAKITVFAS